MGRCSSSSADVGASALFRSQCKVLVTSDIGVGDVRDNHAHDATEEIMVQLGGGFTVELPDGRAGKAGSGLSATNPTEVDGHVQDSETVDAVLLHPRVWRVMKDFEPGTVMLIVADTPYDEADYIRSYDTFLEHAATWDGPGGSTRRSHPK